MRKKQSNKIWIRVILSMFCISAVLTGCGKDEEQEFDDTEYILEEIDESTIVYMDTEFISDDSMSGLNTDSDSADKAESEKEGGELSDNQEDQGAPEGSDPADSQDLYERFLNHEVSATVSDSYPEADYKGLIVQKGESFTLDELEQRVSKYYLDPERTDRTTCDQVQYAYIECPDSSDTAARNLLVKFVGLDIYSVDDDSFAVFVITQSNGQLHITDEYECWARSWDEAYANGTVRSFGSGGAGDHYEGLSVILANGSITNLYGTEILGGWWTSYVNASIYSEVFGENLDPGAFVVSICTIGDDKYYRYDMSECTEDEKILCEDYIDRCKEEQGVNWVSEEEIQAAVRGRCSFLGIRYEITEQQPEVSWTNM